MALKIFFHILIWKIYLISTAIKKPFYSIPWEFGLCKQEGGWNPSPLCATPGIPGWWCWGKVLNLGEESCGDVELNNGFSGFFIVVGEDISAKEEGKTQALWLSNYKVHINIIRDLIFQCFITFAILALLQNIYWRSKFQLCWSFEICVRNNLYRFIKTLIRIILLLNKSWTSEKLSITFLLAPWFTSMSFLPKIHC